MADELIGFDSKWVTAKGTMNRKIRLLVIEDEAAIRTGLIDVFVYHGYEVETAEDGNKGLSMALSGHYDLILLDIMMPGMNGYDVCSKIREQDREQPIIMLTARGGDEDIIQGLTLGADDYVAKPFSVAQLVLRVEAVLRRSRMLLEQSHLIQLGDSMTLDIQNLSGQCGSQTHSFTRREMDILAYLSANSDRPISRGELLDRVWGYANHLEMETRTVDIHVAKIRRKIEPDPANPKFLVTVRGSGYRLLAD
mgnify:CR=1 FL=1